MNVCIAITRALLLHRGNKQNAAEIVLHHLCASRISYSCRVKIYHLKVVNYYLRGLL